MAVRNIKFKNWNWVEKGFQRELLSNVEKVNKAAIGILYDAQKDFVENLPSEETAYMPLITGNLHDSIVGVISHKGRVLRASYTDPVAVKPSEVRPGKTIYSPTSGMGRTRIIGEVYARNTVRNLQGKYPMGLAATMMVTVPYSDNPNEISETNKTGKHAGYLDVLASKYYKNIERGFSLYDKYGLFKWKGANLSWDTPILR